MASAPARQPACWRDSVVVCPLTGVEVAAPLARLRIEPSEGVGLRAASWIMVERITAIRRERIGARLGCLPREAQVALDRALVVFLGIG